MSDTATPAETAKAEKGAGQYRVLRFVTEPGDHDGYWIDCGTFDARSASDAIRSYGEEGRVVAVPARWWKPMTVRAETTITLNLT